MARARKAILFLTLTVLLLLAVGLFLFACNWTSPPDDAGEPAIVSPVEGDPTSAEDASQGTAEGEGGAQENDPAAETDTGEDDPIDGEDGSVGEEENTNGDTTQEGEGVGGDTTQDEEGAGEPSENGDSDEDTFDYSGYYDTSYSVLFADGLYEEYIYRQVHSDRVGVVYKVYVEAQEIGTAEVSESGVILFDCGFVDERCALWGTWDEEGPSRYFVYFETFDLYREILFRDELAEPALQLDIQLGEISYFSANNDENLSSDTTNEITQGSGEEHPSEIRCATCLAVMIEGGSHDPSCGKYASLPEGSVFFTLLCDARGVWEDLSEEMPTGEEGENYRIDLRYVTEEGLTALREKLTALYAAGWVSETVFHAGDLATDGKIGSLDAVISEANGAFSVRFDLRAYAVE